MRKLLKRGIVIVSLGVSPYLISFISRKCNDKYLESNAYLLYVYIFEVQAVMEL